MVQINASVRLEDGRMLIATIGQRRFRIQYMLQTLPYLVASVAMLPDESDAGLTRSNERLRAAHEEYWNAIKAATGSAPDVEALPSDIVAMSYHLAHRLQVSNDRKQHWLEVSVAQRMREITAMLRAEIALLPRPGDERTSGPSNLPWSWN
jgi:Lon protease-like protein